MRGGGGGHVERGVPAVEAVGLSVNPQPPTAVLARLLGLHPITATCWSQEAGNSRPAYAAQIARAHGTATTGP